MYYNKNHEDIVEERKYKYIGSYKTNEITIDDKNKNKRQNYIRVKCLYCGKEYDIRLSSVKEGRKCINCCNSYENSFAYYIQQELKEPLNKYWDWEKNELNPYLIYKGSRNKIWIKCDKVDYHESYKIACNNFYKGDRCPYCRKTKVHSKDSFAQWGINTFGKDFLTKYWSPKNTLNPWKLAPQSNKKIWILCQEKDYHNDDGGYPTTCDHFYRGNRCPYCNHKKGYLHLKDSFGYLYPQRAKYWSKNNKKSPFEVAPKSNDKYKFICQECGEEFETSPNTSVLKNRSVKCKNCNSSKGEQRIKEWLIDNNIKFEQQKTFKYLIGAGNGLLSYDFYLPQYNLLIEYQGKQHEKFVERFHKSEEDFIIQKEHDRRKKKYTKDNNIELLEIWYYDYENIEKVLDNIIKV